MLLGRNISKLEIEQIYIYLYVYIYIHTYKPHISLLSLFPHILYVHPYIYYRRLN